MRDKALVVAIKETHVLVLPLLTDTCINCNEAACAKKGTPFAVINAKKLPIVVGSVVKVASSVKKQAFQAFIALILPLGAGIAAYFLPALFMQEPAEGIHALFALLGFLCTSFIVFVTKRHIKDSGALITDIVYEQKAAISNPLLNN